MAYNKKRRKPNNRVFYSPDTEILKSASNPGNLKRGWESLAALWKLGLTPKDIRPHFFMTWLAYWNGNVSQLAETMGVHRNTLNHNFQQKLKKRSTYQLRKKWLAIKNQNTKTSFGSNVLQFFSREFSAPRLNSKTNGALINLWLMGVDKKEVNAHFVLWHKRQGRKIYEIAEMLDQEIRSIARAREYYYQKGSPLPKWFKPLKIRRNDWLFPRSKGRPKKKN